MNMLLTLSMNSAEHLHIAPAPGDRAHCVLPKGALCMHPEYSSSFGCLFVCLFSLIVATKKINEFFKSHSIV